MILVIVCFTERNERQEYNQSQNNIRNSIGDNLKLSGKEYVKLVEGKAPVDLKCRDKRLNKINKTKQ